MWKYGLHVGMWRYGRHSELENKSVAVSRCVGASHSCWSIVHCWYEMITHKVEWNNMGWDMVDWMCVPVRGQQPIPSLYV